MAPDSSRFSLEAFTTFYRSQHRSRGVYFYHAHTYFPLSTEGMAAAEGFKKIWQDEFGPAGGVLFGKTQNYLLDLTPRATSSSIHKRLLWRCADVAAAASTQDLSILVHPLTPNAVKLFVETFQAQLTGNIFRLLRADTKADLEEAIKAADAGAKVLNDFVKVNGSSEGGSFFLGSKYSYAETMTTPFVLRALLLKDYKKYDLVGRAKEHGLDRLAAWIEASLSRPSAKTSSPSHEALVETMAGYNQPLKD
ncbi:hypothetical protein WJX84_009116 [Apatococcus fuscideae]|uniref:GST C-terminal domain-containing protein n=1 Tax=Apatococcus fuscideae TaxID=2026836 RepID=A0AAW1TAU1_9CHLO